MRKGIFGGTFDPPHVGHQILAAEALDQLKLDVILWVLTAVPPHKFQNDVSPLNVRLPLVEEVVKEDSRFQLSRVEIDRPPPYYTADTVKILKMQEPTTDFIFLMGGDTLEDLINWKDPEVFIESCEEIGVMCRPGFPLSLESLWKEFPELRPKVTFFETPLLEISSRQIRNRISQNRSYKYFLPECVYELILSKGFYLKQS